MKTLTSFTIVLLIIQAKGYLIKVPTSIQPTIDRTAPLGWIHVQKLLLPLFENVCEESTDPDVVRLSNEFLLNNNYMKPEVFENLQILKSNNGLLPKGEIFTELNQEHKNELKAVYEVLFYAKDFDTFYRAACWARQNLNCGLFVDALYLATINRKDTENVFLPAPYEVLPNYFVQKDYIIKASSLMGGEDISNVDGVRVEGNSYILDVNYTTNLYDESYNSLNYFHEDIDLNSYYFLTKLKSFQWSQNLEATQNRKWGQILYSTLKQLVTRYDLERYSNDLPELDVIDWDNLNELLYDPKLIYSNGNEFTQISSINANETIMMKIRNIESNLSTVVINMRDVGYDKSEILNSLMEILVTSETSYEKLALQLLSNVGSVTGSYSVLSHYLTMMRDPILWKVNKKIVELVDDALKVLPIYVKNQLYFPGVEIVSVDVKKIMTSFENFEFDMTDALKMQEIESMFQIKVSQYRLTHKPFSIKINISSHVTQKALVKLFIGPKVLPGEFMNKKNIFMLLDCFEVNLKLGSNVITRPSSEVNNLAKDFISLKTIRKYLLDAEFGVNNVPTHSSQSQTYFPARLILPKGTGEGLPLQMFAFIAPFVKTTLVGSRNNLESNSNTILSPGYPLDLDFEFQNLFDLPNAYFKDILITHKSTAPSTNYNSVGSNNKDWQNSNNEYPRYYNLSSRPSFNKNSFDYKSKKEKYGKQIYSDKAAEQNFNEIKINDENMKKDIEIQNEKENNVTKNITIYKNINDIEEDVKKTISKNIDTTTNSNNLFNEIKISNEENIEAKTIHPEVKYNKNANLLDNYNDIPLANELYEINNINVPNKGEDFYESSDNLQNIPKKQTISYDNILKPDNPESNELVYY